MYIAAKVLEKIDWENDSFSNIHHLHRLGMTNPTSVTTGDGSTMSKESKVRVELKYDRVHQRQSPYNFVNNNIQKYSSPISTNVTAPLGSNNKGSIHIICT